MPRLHHIALSTFVLAFASTPAVAQTGVAVVATAASSTNTVIQANAVGYDAKVTATRAPSYATLINDALALAKPENKTLFVYYGSSGCGWCHQLHNTLHLPELNSILSKYVVLVPTTIEEMDDKEVLNNAGADSALEAMGVTNLGTPKFVFLDPTGKRVITSATEEMGYPLDSADIVEFTGRLKKATPKITDEDQQKIIALMIKRGLEIKQVYKDFDQKAIDDMNKKALEAKKEREAAQPKK